MTRVVVVDDQELVREGLSLILDAQPDLEVVGCAADGVEAVQLVSETDPDVVVMDVRMPRLDGIDATRRILQARPSCRVLVLTTYDADDDVIAALRAGASGFLLKDAPRRSLVAAVRSVAEGDVLLDAGVARRLAASGRPDSADVALAERLTPREREVLDAVARGLSNAEIAAELHLGEATVKTHVSKLLQKLEARDRVQLVVRARGAGA